MTFPESSIENLLSLGYTEDEVQNREPGADILNGMFAAIAEVLATNSSIN